MFNVRKYFFLSKMKNEIPIYAIDFEGSKKLGIVEFGIVGILCNEIFMSETAICAPKSEISKRDADFFGITNAQASKYPPFETYADLFSELRSKGIFAAHNASVEDSLLRSYIPSPGIVTNFFNTKSVLTWAPWLDSRNLAKEFCKDANSEKLSDVIEFLKLEEELNAYAEKICAPARKKWHCALYDALACALIIKHTLPQTKDLNTLACILGVKNQTEELF